MTERQDASNDARKRSERLVTQLTNLQGSLYAYICVLLGNPRDASDVLQETNLVLWRRSEEFDTDRNFTALAYKVAKLQVMAHRKKKANDRHVFHFSEDSLGTMASKLETPTGEFADRVRQLDECIQKLPENQRQLIRMRYQDRLGVKTISESLSKSENSISLALHRARQSLSECVETTSPRGDSP